MEKGCIKFNKIFLGHLHYSQDKTMIFQPLSINKKATKIIRVVGADSLGCQNLFQSSHISEGSLHSPQPENNSM